MGKCWMPTWLEYNGMLIDSCWCVIHIITNYSTTIQTFCSGLCRKTAGIVHGHDFFTRVERRPNAQEHQPLFGEKDKALQRVIVWVWSPSFSQTPGEERAQLRMEQQQLSSTAPVNTLVPDSMTIWLCLLTEDQRYSGLCFSKVGSFSMSNVNFCLGKMGSIEYRHRIDYHIISL